MWPGRSVRSGETGPKGVCQKREMGWGVLDDPVEPSEHPCPGKIAVGGVRVGSALAESPDGGWRWVHEMPHGERETKWRGPESVSYISQAPRLYLDIIL